MAVEFPGQIISLPCVSTGIHQYKFVGISTGGNVIRPLADGHVIGVAQAGTTGSTVDPSTIGVGQVVAATTLGNPKIMLAASVPAGQIIAGSSGGAGRVLSVLIAGVGASTATI
jgi:hypothetical protein